MGLGSGRGGVCQCEGVTVGGSYGETDAVEVLWERAGLEWRGEYEVEGKEEAREESGLQDGVDAG